MRVKYYSILGSDRMKLQVRKIVQEFDKTTTQHDNT